MYTMSHDTWNPPTMKIPQYFRMMLRKLSFLSVESKSPEQIYAAAAQDDGTDEDELDLLYDSCLNCYYDPKTQKYYELIWPLHQSQTMLQNLLPSTNEDWFYFLWNLTWIFLGHFTFYSIQWRIQKF